MNCRGLLQSSTCAQRPVSSNLARQRRRKVLHRTKSSWRETYVQLRRSIVPEPVEHREVEQIWCNVLWIKASVSSRSLEREVFAQRWELELDAESVGGEVEFQGRDAKAVWTLSTRFVGQYNLYFITTHWRIYCLTFIHGNNLASTSPMITPTARAASVGTRRLASMMLQKKRLIIDSKLAFHCSQLPHPCREDQDPVQRPT